MEPRGTGTTSSSKRVYRLSIRTIHLSPFPPRPSRISKSLFCIFLPPFCPQTEYSCDDFTDYMCVKFLILLYHARKNKSMNATRVGSAVRQSSWRTCLVSSPTAQKVLENNVSIWFVKEQTFCVSCPYLLDDLRVISTLKWLACTSSCMTFKQSA